MKILSIIIFAILITVRLEAAELRLFNPDVLQKSVSEPLPLTLPAGRQAIDPVTISTDIVNGTYAGATVLYPKTVAFLDASVSLDKLYGKFKVSLSSNKPRMELWRVEESRFAIQLTETQEAIQVVYLPFSGKRQERLH